MHRLTRLAPSAVLIAATALSVAACSSSASTSPGANSSTPTQGGSLTFIQQIEPSCLDPVQLGDMHQATFALQYLDSLVATDADGKVLPWLATSWEISPDGKVYTFRLKEGVKFTDGTPFDAAAVKANFDRIKTTTGSASQYLIYVDKTEVVDANTVEVALSRPFVPFLQQIAQSFVGIQSPTALKRGDDENCQSPVGTGPFIVDSYTPGDQAVLVRNEDYNSAPPTAEHDGPAYVDQVVWRFIPDPTARFSAVKTGQADAADGLTAINEKQAAKDDSLAVQSHDYPGHPEGVMFKTNLAPFDDVRVRQAFKYGADVDAALESIFFGLYERPGVLSPTTTDFDPSSVDAYTHDPDKANALLDEAGWTERTADGYRVKDGESLTVHWLINEGSQLDTYRTFAEQIQATEKEIGIEVVFESAPATDWTAYTKPEYQATYMKYTLNSPDVLRLLWATDAFINTDGLFVDDPDLQKAVSDAAIESDPAKRSELYATAQQRISDQAYGLTLFPESVRILSNTSRVQGIRQEPVLGLVNLQDAWVTK
ncbi:ABC transporter substrate-binding protein [Nocardioides sp. W7]|uniref:ABC transporter substrate-binding protein n=1 Tax=Nocardioides sp. W7 TaxID=2931390 RepID=UPI001FD1D9B5|nr:ABC transporter substrate-binding protein [Nocardioides sp. W7]